MIPALLATAFAAEVQRYAVVVGVNEGVSGDEPLLFASSDADRVADVLEDLGDIPSENIVRLKDVDAARLADSLEDLARRVERRKGTAETLLFFYYSGHGDSDGLHLTGTQLPFRELLDDLGAIPVDVRILVVDACQSGELTRLKGASPAEPFEIQADDRLDTEGMAIITSSSVGEDAQESDRLQGGVFTHHFLSGLKGAADASGDHRVTLTEAYAYGYAETVKSTSRARFVQRPGFGFALSGRNDLVLTRVDDPGRNAMLALDGAGQWLVMEGDGSGRLVSEVFVEQDAMLAVNPGPYLVRFRDEKGIREASVDVPKGSTHPVAARAMAAVSPGRTVRKGMQEDTRAAMAWTVGTGILGPTAPEIQPSAVGTLGLMVDFEPMTLAVRGIGSGTNTRNDQIGIRQVRAGADIAGLKKVDFRKVALGLGVRGGGDLNFQWFATTGEARPKQALTGRLGPLLSVDVPFARNLLIVSGGTDVQVAPLYDVSTDTDRLGTTVVPTLNLELARYVRR
ncbi:MAG: caspase family protein [Myxococcales bacterium]|nr:caspase family protein [Myxococcales bacterium]MCB9670114.1 caspase family protein [Alphaproteobacteria bacterium]MCB9693554.1 caspase family protein [Alphaproteobacteria bacterium]